MNNPNEISERDYLESQYFEDDEVELEVTTNKSYIQSLKDKYTVNKKAKVGERLICPVCGIEFKKKVPQQAFCFTKCKDKFWNFVDWKRFMRLQIYRSKY